MPAPGRTGSNDGRGRSDAVDVAATMDSGQVFLWDLIGDAYWYGVDGQDVLRVDQASGAVSTYAGKRWRRGGGARGDLMRSRDDMEAVTGSLPRDGVMDAALRRYGGLRVMRQDPFQCTISFITSANSNIQRIRANLAKIAETFGRPVTVRNVKRFHLFPTPEDLARASVREVQECGVGYRAKYIVEASEMIASGRVNFERIRRMPDYADVMDAVREIPGVGRKVADCIMLFSLDRLDAFPLDRWMIRVLRGHYKDILELPGSPQSGSPPHALTDSQYMKCHESIAGYFGPCAGYAQQLLFKMARDDAGAAWRKPQKNP